MLVRHQVPSNVRRERRGLVLAIFCLALSASAPDAAAAADTSAGSTPPPVAAPAPPQKEPLAGIKPGLQEQSEVWANLVGGGKRGLSYDGLTTASLAVDLDKTLGWTGARFFVSAFDFHGHGPSGSFIGNQQLVSNLEVTPSVKLYDLWLEQDLPFGGSLRLGQEGANDEMMTTAYGALFLNASFGFPGMAAADLPSGGTNYPLAAPFVRVQAKASEKLTLVGAVYTGDPAPPGRGDPQIRDRNGTAFRLDDHALIFGEARYEPDPEAPDTLPTTYKLGAWYASNHFADQRYDSAGGLLANPASSGLARQHTGDFGIYGSVDQMVWRRAGTQDQGVGLFLQVMAGPSDRNLSNLFIAGGMSWRGPFSSRPDDIGGLAFTYLGISPAAQNYSRDLVSLGRAGSAYAGSETVIEATYQAPITTWLTLQPDAQLVVKPNAGIPGPFGNSPLADDLIIGLRVTIKL